MPTGQLLCLLNDPDNRRMGHQGRTLSVAVGTPLYVDWRRALGDDGDKSFDQCRQAVLPFKRSEGAVGAVRHDVEVLGRLVARVGSSAEVRVRRYVGM